MSKWLIDTNILVYFKDTSSAYHQVSAAVIASGNQLFTTSKNLSEYYAVVTKGDTPLLTSSEALEDILEFTDFIEILYPSQASYHKLIQLATILHPKGLKIHDIEIAAISLAGNVHKIATFNLGDFRKIPEIELVEL